MGGRGRAEAGRGPTQAFRNAVALLVIGGVVGTLALIYVLLLPNQEGIVGGVCTIAFLLVAIVAWEFVMKPGYGRLQRRPDPEDPPEDSAGPP